MNILALAIFAFCVWAVFNHKFVDGILAKSFLAASAISSAVAYLDHQNLHAAFLAVMFLASGLIYWYYRKDAIKRWYQRHTPRHRSTDPKG